MTHILKTWPEPFAALWSGAKTAEFRRDDRDFQVGDFLRLLEYNQETNRFTNRWIIARITDIRRGGFVIPEGFALLSIRQTRRIVGDEIVWTDE